jgi:hypothetical protein
MPQKKVCRRQYKEKLYDSRGFAAYRTAGDLAANGRKFGLKHA